jgi:hypothetical protein
MSENTGGYVGVVIFAVVFGVLAYLLQWRTGNPIDMILAVAAVVFCLGMLIRQRWALIGACLTLLVGIGIYFIRTWSQPIMAEDASLVLPNVLKMLGGIVLLIYIGRQKIEHSVFSAT